MIQGTVDMNYLRRGAGRRRLGWGDGRDWDGEGGNGEGEVESWQGPGVGEEGEAGSQGGWIRRSGVGRGRQEGGNGEKTGRGDGEGATWRGRWGGGQREEGDGRGGKGEGEKKGQEEGAFYRWIWWNAIGLSCKQIECLGWQRLWRSLIATSTCNAWVEWDYSFFWLCLPVQRRVPQLVLTLQPLRLHCIRNILKTIDIKILSALFVLSCTAYRW